MKRAIQVFAFLLAMPCAAQQAQQAGQPVPMAQGSTGFEVRVFPLEYIKPGDAAQLISPFLLGLPTGGVYESGSATRAVTVRAPRALLVRIDSLLRAVDHAPAAVTLKFQIIAAVDSAVRDGGVAVDVDTTLRRLFRFGGYRLLAQGLTTVGVDNFELIMYSGLDQYSLNGTVQNIVGEVVNGRFRGNQDVQLKITLSSRVRVDGVTTSERTMSTTLVVPWNQTAVIGGLSSRDAKSLILTVRPEQPPSAGR